MIMSKAVAARIKKVSPDKIHHNQTGFVEDRSIFDIMDFTVKENAPGLMPIFKAFDSLEWDYILKCREVFNFGPNFIPWVDTFYKNIQSCVINNGCSSDYFTLERGVRQGDPLSLIFLL